MTRKFISTLCAAAVAVTSFSAAPAYADRDDDIARALAAVLGVAILGKIIHESKKDDKGHVTRRYDPKPEYRPHKPRRVERDTYRVQPRDLPRRVQRNTHRRVDRKLLPGQCLRSFESRRGGRVVMMGRKCLENNYRFAHRLPQKCAQRVRTHNGKRSGYDARCLRLNGYRLTRS